MVASLSIDNVPDDVVHRIRERALRNRSLRPGELLSILQGCGRPRGIEAVGNPSQDKGPGPRDRQRFGSNDPGRPRCPVELRTPASWRPSSSRNRSRPGVLAGRRQRTLRTESRRLRVDKRRAQEEPQSPRAEAATLRDTRAGLANPHDVGGGGSHGGPGTFAGRADLVIRRDLPSRGPGTAIAPGHARPEIETRRRRVGDSHRGRITTPVGGALRRYINGHGKAAVFVEPYHFEMVELPPVPVGPGGIRVKIKSGGICGSDLHFWRGELKPIAGGQARADDPRPRDGRRRRRARALTSPPTRWAGR